MHQSMKRVLQVIVLILALFAVAAYLSLRPRQEAGVGLFERQEISPQEVSAVVKAVLPEGPIRTLTGSVVAVRGDRVIVDVPAILMVRIPQESDLRVRTVLVGERTKLFEYQRRASAAAVGSRPSPYQERTIALSELKEGDAVRVLGAPRDIKTATTFQAASIARYR
jgi:hypothetical protein